jgi:hypothetical protein
VKSVLEKKQGQTNKKAGKRSKKLHNLCHAYADLYHDHDFECLCCNGEYSSAGQLKRTAVGTFLERVTISMLGDVNESSTSGPISAGCLLTWFYEGEAFGLRNLCKQLFGAETMISCRKRVIRRPLCAKNLRLVCMN